jgi:general secretion pathway protein A
MYANFFGLKHEPFSIAPDPRYLFMSERHREALAHLLYGVNGGGGFVLLSGEIGAGKTTVCRCFLEQIPKRTKVAYIFNPKLTVVELLQSVCIEFGVPLPEFTHREVTVKDYLDPLNAFLLRTHATGQNNVLIIDEAQMLSADVLEQLRLLTNLETNERKLLQIILIGQPELRDMLARPELEQLAQRVIARYHLGALTEAETGQYIRHRLGVAGMTTAMPFDARALRLIHEYSRGVPRRINLLCDRALLGAYALGRGQVDRAIVDKAAAEVFDRERRARLRRRRRRVDRAVAWGLGGASAAAAVAAVVYASGALRPNPSERAVAAAGASAPASAAVAVAASVAAAGSAPAPAFLTAADLPLRFKTLTYDEKEAWRALAPAWKVTLGDGDPCVEAARSQLQCFRTSNSTLALIRQLDRPGIVTLHDAEDRPVYALLTGLTDRSATVRIGADTHAFSLVSLATLWRGDYATFWRAPPGYSGKLVDSTSGPLTTWFNTQLASVHGADGTPTDAPGEAAWKARVAAFQLSQGLKPDGLAGPTTFMQLNRATGLDEPHLRTDPTAH